MTKNDAFTYGAVAFAAFALFYVFKKTPSKAIATQPGQQQRDAGLTDWMGIMLGQEDQLSAAANINQYRGLVGELGI